MCLLICQDEVPAGSWLWHRLVGYHVIQLLLFIGRYFLFVNTWAARLAEWLISGDTVGVDVSHRIFNVECRVSPLSVQPLTVYSHSWSTFYKVSAIHDRMGDSFRKCTSLSERSTCLVG